VINLSVQADRNDKRIQALLTLAMNQGVGVTRSSKRDLDALVSERHQGVVATIEPLDVQVSMSEKELLVFLKVRPQPLVLVLDGVTDPHNLGACLRSADAAVSRSGDTKRQQR